MPQNLIFETLGNVELLSQNRFAIFASRKAPAELMIPAGHLLSALKGSSFSVAGGWQSPLEKQVFNLLTQGIEEIHLIHYLARSLSYFKPSQFQQKLLKEKRILFIAPPLRQPRASSREVLRRDALLFRQVTKILFLTIQPGGRLERYLDILSRQKYSMFILEHPANQAFYESGLVKVNADNASLLLA